MTKIQLYDNILHKKGDLVFMKYYQELAQLGIFTIDDVINVTGNRDKAEKATGSLLKNGVIRRIKRNLYSAVNPYTLEDFSNRFIIASNITDSSFVSYHSAFEFYGFYNQVFYEVQVSSKKKFKQFTYGEYEYTCFETNSLKQVEIIQETKIVTIERAIVDSINMLGKVMDVEELVKCIDLVHRVDEEKMKEMLLEYDKDILYRKVGYFLSYFKEDLNISDDFFVFCKEHSNCKNVGIISSGEVRNLEYVIDWGLYAYKDLKKIIEKFY